MRKARGRGQPGRFVVAAAGARHGPISSWIAGVAMVDARSAVCRPGRAALGRTQTRKISQDGTDGTHEQGVAEARRATHGAAATACARIGRFNRHSSVGPSRGCIAVLNPGARSRRQCRFSHVQALLSHQPTVPSCPRRSFDKPLKECKCRELRSSAPGG